MPSLENLHQHFKGEEFVLLSIDVGEKIPVVSRFAKDKGLSFGMLVDEDSSVTARYGVRSHPMKFLIEKNGDLRGVAMGYREWDSDEMKSLVRKLMDS